MHTLGLWLSVLGQDEDTKKEVAEKVEDKMAEVGAEVKEAVQVDSAAELMQNLLELAQKYLVPFAINLVVAIIIFVIGRWIARAITAFFRRLANRANVDETLTKFLANIIYTILMTLVVLAALQRLGIDTTSVAAILAAAGLAVGFALQGSLSNFAAGVMLIIFKPFKVGDFVEAGGVSGVVEEIQIFNTLMRTPDNIQNIVPNSAITAGTITNFSAKDTRRVDLVVGCGYQDNLKEVKEFLEQLCQGDERILEDPAPVVAVNELGDNSVNFVVRPWVKSGDYWDVRWELNEAIKNGFDERGFNIPYPSQDVYVHNKP